MSEVNISEQPDPAQEVSPDAAVPVPKPALAIESPPASDWGPAIFVWGSWVLMVIGTLAFALKYGSFVPIGDEWNVAPALAGEPPLSPQWLWKADGDHRLPLGKLILVVLYRVFPDYRAGHLATAVCFSLLAFVMIGTARRLRGWTSYTDAFFPLVLQPVNSERVKM